EDDRPAAADLRLRVQANRTAPLPEQGEGPRGGGDLGAEGDRQAGDPGALGGAVVEDGALHRGRRPGVEQDRDFVGRPIGRGEVGEAVAVEVPHYYRLRPVAGGIVPGRAEGAVAVA